MFWIDLKHFVFTLDSRSKTASDVRVGRATSSEICHVGYERFLRCSTWFLSAEGYCSNFADFQGSNS